MAFSQPYISKSSKPRTPTFTAVKHGQRRVRWVGVGYRVEGAEGDEGRGGWQAAPGGLSATPQLPHPAQVALARISLDFLNSFNAGQASLHSPQRRLLDSLNRPQLTWMNFSRLRRKSVAPPSSCPCRTDEIFKLLFRYFRDDDSPNFQEFIFYLLHLNWRFDFRRATAFRRSSLHQNPPFLQTANVSLRKNFLMQSRIQYTFNTANLRPLPSRFKTSTQEMSTSQLMNVFTNC
ncbi:unnamed protein product [Nesidiocoris tenuis]|uniref:Uncharacterized protein n=1 Tax=Nesidiocoris tenuis TaxID=355587 RepID=A0A6H5HHA5_9HEMI|nr:unnamed protein product [Nesidiocoris tenuis]